MSAGVGGAGRLGVLCTIELGSVDGGGFREVWSSPD